MRITRRPRLSTFATTPATDRQPALAYLRALSPGASRTSQKHALRRIAQWLGQPNVARTPWHQVDHAVAVYVRECAAALPGRSGKGASAATINKYVCALRGVLRAAWRLGLMSAEQYQLASAVPGAKGVGLQAGRALSKDEVAGLYAACAADPSVAGRRDAAMLSLLYAAGLRRAEAVLLNVDDYDPHSGALRVLGKGGRERIAYVSRGAKPTLAAWLNALGRTSGPLLRPVSQKGCILHKSISGQAVMMRLQRRAREAAVGHCSPHDLRRTYVSELLDAGADLPSVQRLAGHASPDTTARYDRRGERAKRRASNLLPAPEAAMRKAAGA